MPIDDASIARWVTPRRALASRISCSSTAGGRQRAVARAALVDEADRSERSGFMTERLPDLAQEGDDGGLAARARHQGDLARLARVKPRGGERQRAARVGNEDDRQSGRRQALRDDGDGAARRGVGDEIQTVALVAGNGEKQESRPDAAAVGADPGDPRSALDGRKIGAGQEILEAHQCAAPAALALETAGVMEQL
jgi:hypothetical protein